MTYDLQGLKLDRPLVVFDLETTGLDFDADRIVECACLKIHPDGSSDTWHHFFNPQRSIPPEVLEILKIDSRDLEDKPLFTDLAEDLYEFLKDCDLAGFNHIKFDIPFLEAEFARTGHLINLHENRYLIDAKNIFFHFHPRNLSAAVSTYLNRSHADAHEGMADTLATAEVLLAQLHTHPDLPRTPKELDDFCRPTDKDAYDRDGKIKWDEDRNGYVLTFGKHRNRLIGDLLASAPDYLKWICNADFSFAVKSFIHTALSTGTVPNKKIPPATS